MKILISPDTRTPLSEDMSIEEMLAVMSEGNSRALYILTEIVQKNAAAGPLILDMDDMNIRGKQIEIGVEVCLNSIKRFARMVFERTPWLVQEINKQHHTHRAVTYGASDTKDR